MKTFAHSLAAVTFLIGGLSVHAAAPTKAKKTGDYAGLPKTAIPQNVYGVFSVDDALKDALKKKRALTFMVTDERADDPAVKKAGTTTFWALQDDSIVVVLRNSTAGEWKRLPANISAALKSPDLGKGYPNLVSATEDASTLLAGMTSSTLVALDEKALNKFGKELKKLNAAKTPSTDYPPPNPAAVAPPAPPAPAGATVKPAEKPGAPAGTPATAPPAPTPPAAPVVIKNPRVEKWTNTDGVTIQATLVEVREDAVTFETSFGGKVNYDLSKLSDASKKRIEELKAASK